MAPNTRGPLNSAEQSTSVVVGGVYNQVAPAPQDEQACALQLDNEGNLLVNVAVFSGSITATNPSVGLDNATAPTSSTQIGTQDIGGKLQAVSASNPLPISGNITATNPSVGTNGAATPTSSTAIGGSDGTNLQQLKVESSSNPNLRVGIFNGATEASVTGANALKVDGSAVTQPVSIAAAVTVQQPTAANLNATVTGTVVANQGTITDTAPATQNITAQDVASATTAVANGGSFITGAPTANSAASFALASGFDSVAFQVTGTWTGTVAIEASMDGGTTWVSAGVHQQGTSYLASSFTANFIGEHNSANYTNVRVRATAAWTGTATVKISQSINPRIAYVANPIKIQDGTTQSTVVTVKAASTQAASTDTSLVVQLNPNQPNLTTPLNENVSQIGGSAVSTAATGVQKVGIVGNAGGVLDVAVNGTLPANAVQTSARATTTLPTASTQGNTVLPMASVDGALVVRGAAPRERLIKNSLTLTATGSNTLIAAGAASIFRDLTFLQASNTSSTNVRVDISDGTTTYSWFLAASGGGFNLNFNPPLAAATAATAWTAAISANVTDVRISAQAAETH